MFPCIQCGVLFNGAGLCDHCCTHPLTSTIDLTDALSWLQEIAADLDKLRTKQGKISHWKDFVADHDEKFGQCVKVVAEYCQRQLAET